MPSRGASPRDQTVPCGLPNPLAFVSQVRAASLATKSAGSRPPVQLPNSRSLRTEVDPTASRLGETAHYGSLSTMEAGSDAWCFLDRQTSDCDFMIGTSNAAYRNVRCSVRCHVCICFSRFQAAEIDLQGNRSEELGALFRDFVKKNVADV
jgi:hypothetical protein